MLFAHTIAREASESDNDQRPGDQSEKPFNQLELTILGRSELLKKSPFIAFLLLS